MRCAHVALCLGSTALRPAAAMLSTSACNAKYVIAVDGIAGPSEQASKDFLLSRPSGAYTTARTCSRARRLFEWDTHVQRTAASVDSMLRDDARLTTAEARMLSAQLGTSEALRPQLDATVAAAMQAYIDAHGDDTELKVTALVNWKVSTTASIACHVAPLPPLPVSPVKVEVRGAPRSNAMAKDSSWVADRAPLEALMGADFNELLLATEDGELLEGSQTNFFAVQDGAVVTAGDGVLAGTVRRLLLEVCDREGIPVIFRPPRLSEASQWDGVLISSTSRLLLPVDELYVPVEGRPSVAADRRAQFDNGPGSLTARLRDRVSGEVVAHSVAMIA